MLAKGVNGQMEIVGDNLVLTRGLMFGRSKGRKEIAIASITSVQFKAAGLMSGFLQVAFSGGQESKAGILAAASDENTIMFDRSGQMHFEILRDELNRRRAVKPAAPATAPPPAAPPALADQIAALADLHRQGALTDDEFAAAKRRLLG